MTSSEITAERVQAAIAVLREALELPETTRVSICFGEMSIREALRFSADNGENLQWHFKDLALYTRAPFSNALGYVYAMADVTPANLHELPTEGLRARARQLLELAEGDE